MKGINFFNMVHKYIGGLSSFHTQYQRTHIENKQKVKMTSLILEGKHRRENLKVTLGYIYWNMRLNIVCPISKIIKTWGEERSRVSLYDKSDFILFQASIIFVLLLLIIQRVLESINVRDLQLHQHENE